MNSPNAGATASKPRACAVPTPPSPWATSIWRTWTLTLPVTRTGGPALTALPAPDYDLSAWQVRQASVTRELDEGDVIDLGNRHFEVLHLMGLPVQVVHAGHDPSFGRDRLRELALAYLERLDDPA